ncbi:uncharacterized protein LOC128740718 [Sabethes cyaneus]|uniref:uncharacterized protein LOC128740718 n=1 Tax=Sabethes cyaneus TaxID=53552 RepID=UPI00237E897F|nr:uncharacterized protein LOC128740718 [Sabethes cyaneus]
MNLKLSTTLVVLFVAYSRAQLLCFYCDDCDNYTAEVEACGISRPAQTTTPVASTTTTTSTSSDPTTTPPTTTPEVPGTTTTTPLTTPGEPILTPPTLPAQITTTTTVLPTAGDPILTPPTIPNWSSSTQGDHLATPPITPLPSANVDQKNGERIVIPLEPNTSYACSMISTTAVIFVLGGFIATDAQLLCYHCDDCLVDTAVVQPCGFDVTILTQSNWGKTMADGPVLTPPAGGDIGATENPQGPILTPPTSAPGDDNTGNSGNPILTPPGGTDGSTIGPNPADPILTPPTFPDGGVSSDTPNAGGGGGWVTPPITMAPLKGAEAEANGDQYVCLMATSTVNNRKIVRRGCTQLGYSSDETCSRLTGGQHRECTICNSHLCNSGA